jgi:hypothetical protein
MQLQSQHHNVQTVMMQFLLTQVQQFVPNLQLRLFLHNLQLFEKLQNTDCDDDHLLQSE